MILVFWILNFKPTFSLSSFTFIKRLFSSSSLSAIRLVSSVHLRLLIFLPAILIPAYASSSPAFCMMCSSYMSNKQGDNIQPWRTPFPIWNQSAVPCPVLTVASLQAHRFLKKRGRNILKITQKTWSQRSDTKCQNRNPSCWTVHQAFQGLVPEDRLEWWPSTPWKHSLEKWTQKLSKRNEFTTEVPAFQTTKHKIFKRYEEI